jgi:hypothetical protein
VIGFRFFWVHVVADTCAKLDTVGVLPHLDADNAQYEKTYNECAPNEQRLSDSRVLGVKDFFDTGHTYLLEEFRSQQLIKATDSA